MRRHVPLLLGCLILSSTCLAQRWTQISPTTSPSTRYVPGMAYDSARQRTVLFGGGGPNKNDTWEYDGKTWTQIRTTTSPSARHAPGMVYDAKRKRVVLFGGWGGTSTNDTWEYDGKNWTQIKTTTSPPRRAYHVMAYDSIFGRTVVFGGSSDGSFNGTGDTWEYDGKNWTQVKTSASPMARVVSAMAYDRARLRMVLFGGWTSNRVRSNETWEFDRVRKTWTQTRPTTSPPGRGYHVLGYDEMRKRMVTFGGIGASGLMGDTWEYDGKTWTQIKTTTSPSARSWPGMAHDSDRQRMVLFAGTGRSDTWEYVGSQPLTGSPSSISIATGGTHTFSLNAGTANASRLYWIFGSVTGTSPGVTLASPAGSVNIPLNPDFWTDITIGLANSALLTKTRGALDGSGKGSATFNVPKITNQSAVGVKFYHAYLVYDAQGNFHMASNPVELVLVK